MDSVRWGIIGTGNIANKFANAIKNVENAELVAVASRSEETSKKFAGKYNIPYHFSNYEDMANFNEVDIVYIATPHTLHSSCSNLLLKAKKNVLCEKPIAVNEKELNKMIATAKENNVFIMEALWTRFLPAIRKLETMIKDGIIGDIRGISADFCYNLSTNKEHHVFNSKFGGDSLLDVGIYALNFASIFLGSSPSEIKAMAEIANSVDEHNHILLSYPNGAIARLSSAITVEKPSDAYIYGSKGYIYIPHFY